MKPGSILAAIASVACIAAVGAQPSPRQVAVKKTEAPAGAYTLDHAHADLTFRLSHLGFSMYTARFAKFDATLQFDPARPARTSVTATIDATSLTLPAPPEGFTKSLLGPQWLDAGKYPQILFRSTRVDVTGPDTARISGSLTLHGVTRPVTLQAKFNGGYAGHPMDPNGRIGFSATGVFKRSDFGISYGIPAPGTTMGVGDDVEVVIETEFTGPPKR